MKIGRRPVYILGTFLNLIGCILGGVQTTILEYYWVNILTGFGAAPVDSLVQISTTDIFFAHERGTRLSFFALALGTGSYMGPVAAGYITEAQSWMWCFWYLVVFFGILLVLEVFTLEESVYRRQRGSVDIDTSEVATLDDRPQSDIKSMVDDGAAVLQTTRNRTDTLTTLLPPGPRKTYWQRMAPIHTLHANPRPWWFLAIFPFRLVTFPAVVWAGFMGGIQIWWLSLLSVTQSEIFSEPPYNFGIAAGKYLPSPGPHQANMFQWEIPTSQLSSAVSSVCYGVVLYQTGTSSDVLALTKASWNPNFVSGYSLLPQSSILLVFCSMVWVAIMAGIGSYQQV
jgi:MFS family permease